MKKLLVIALLALMVFTSGCSRAITFERIAGDDLGRNYIGKDARIYVIASKQTLPTEVQNWLVFSDSEGNIVNSLGRDAILDVDYSKYFVVLVFNGYRGVIWTTFYIQKIEQSSDIISITSRFNDRNGRTSLRTAESSQYQAVKISRDQVTQRGLTTFRLLDESGKERARTTYELNP